MSAPTNFPVFCSVGHPRAEFASIEDLINHHGSAHSDTPIADYFNSLTTSPTGGPDNAAPVPTVILTSPIAIWGLNREAFTSFSSSDISSGSELSVQQILDFLLHFGSSRDPVIVIDVAAFLLDFFQYCLYNAATNDATPTGSLFLRAKGSDAAELVRWSTVFSAARDYFEPLGYAFTPRRMMRVCDPVFWTLWNDNKIEALARVRSEGTPISRQFRLPNGKHPHAYVTVPQLFTAHLTEDERAVRKMHQYKVTKLSQSQDAPAYEGLDPDDTVAASSLTARSMELRSARIAAEHTATRTRGGIGSGSAPKADRIMEDLYGGRPEFRHY